MISFQICVSNLVERYERKFESISEIRDVQCTIYILAPMNR